MKTLTKLVAGLGAATAFAAAVPASAQYYPDRDVVDEVVDGVARVAGAVAQVSRGGYYDPRYNSRYGYNQGGERYAADACAYEAQRRYSRRYGGAVNVDIRDVQWYRSNRLRVYGTLAMDDYGRSNGYGAYGRNDRYGRADPYRYNSYGRYDRRIGFTCTVRPDGRVTDFDTNRAY